MNYYEKDTEQIVFNTLSGQLIVKRYGSHLEMEMPKYELSKVEITDEMEEALGVRSW